MELLELSMQDGKAGTNKQPFVFIQPGVGVWERPHYTVARINLGPCLLLSPWEPDTMHYRALRILNTYLNPWCRLLIDLHVRWRTEHTRQCNPDVEYTGGKSWVRLYCTVFFMALQFDFYSILSQNSRNGVRSGETTDLRIYIQLHELTLETAWVRVSPHMPVHINIC